MKMWGQEVLFRCWVGKGNIKSDFGQTKPIFPQALETKTLLSTVTIEFRKNPNSSSGPAAARMEDWRGPVPRQAGMPIPLGQEILKGEVTAL